MTCLVTLFDRKLQVFINLSKLTIFGIFNKLLSSQNVNVECDFFCDFYTLCDYLFVYLTFLSIRIHFSIHEKTLQVVLCKESKSHQNANWGDQGRLWILPCTSGFRVWSDGAKEAEMTLILETNPHTPIFTFRHTRIC